MELIKEDIQRLKIKSRATSQVTFDVDYNVPDARPDIGRLIQSKGNVTIDEVRMSDGHAYLKGTLDVDILYVDEEQGKICSMSAKLPMEETLNLDGIASGDKMCLKWEIEDLSIHVIHSRKMNIKAIVAFYAVVDEVTGIRLPAGVKDGDITVQKKTVQTMNLSVHKKDTLRIRDEMILASNKPNISELIWHTIEIRGLDLRPEENKIRAKGEMIVFILYAGEGEAESLQWLEYTLPFNREMECRGSCEDMIPNIDTAILSQGIDVRPDADGEERVLSVDVVMEMDMKLYEEVEKDLLLDAYSPKKECILHTREEILETLLVRNFSRCRIGDHIEVRETQGKVLQVCHTEGKVKVDKTQVVENGIRVDGIIQMKILYIIGNDDMPFYSMEAMIPFSHLVEARGISRQSLFYLKTDLEQLSTTMTESNRLEVKAVICLNVLVLNQQKEKIIEQIEEEPLDMEKIRNMPGITVYFVKPKDTLWDIAKRYYTTVEEIKEQNHLEHSTLIPGQPLLLVKKMS